MSTESDDIADLLKSVHEFSQEEKNKLKEIHDHILSIAEYQEQGQQLKTKIKDCWSDIEKIVAVYIAIRTDEKITEKELSNWFNDLKKCLEQLSDLLTLHKVSRYGIFLLDLDRASKICSDKDKVEEIVNKRLFQKFLQMFLKAIGIFTCFVSDILEKFPTKGGRPANRERYLLSLGIERVFVTYEIPFVTGRDTDIAAQLIEQILLAFADNDEKIGSPRHYMQKAKKNKHN